MTAANKQGEALPLRIEVFSEVTCPWCLIGLRRLDNVLSKYFPELHVDIEHKPVILMPDVPDSGLNIADLLKERYGIVDPSAAWIHPEAEARASGIPLSLARQPFAYRTDRAHVLISHSRALGTQHKLALAIIEAYFLDGRDIGNPDVLADIAGNYGFSSETAQALVRDERELEAVRRLSASARNRGITSVPHLILDDRIHLKGSSEAALGAAIEQTLASRSVAGSVTV